MALLKTVTKDSLVFHVFDTRAEGGALAAREGADVIRDLLSKQEKVNIRRVLRLILCQIIILCLTRVRRIPPNSSG